MTLPRQSTGTTRYFKIRESRNPQNLEFQNSPKFRNLKFSISPNLLLSDREALRAWLDVRKRVLNTRPRALAPRFLTMSCMTLSWQSTGTVRNFKFREISDPSILKFAKTWNFKTHKIHKLAKLIGCFSRRVVSSLQHSISTTLHTTSINYSQPAARNAEAPTCPCGAGSSTSVPFASSTST